MRKQDRDHFDQLFTHAADHADAAGYQNPTDPFRAVLLSIVLEQQKELAELRDRVDESV